MKNIKSEASGKTRSQNITEYRYNPRLIRDNNFMKPEIKQRSIIAKSRLFSIEQVDLEFSNGAEAQFEQICGMGQGGVLVIPLLNQDTLILIEEYALGVDRYELGFVKGLVDPGESVQQAAVRELEEEAGFTSSNATVLGDFTMMPAYSNFHHHIIVVDNLSPKSRQGDEPEPLEQVHWPINQLEELRHHPRFSDARCHLALYLLSDYLKSREFHV